MALVLHKQTDKGAAVHVCRSVCCLADCDRLFSSFLLRLPEHAGHHAAFGTTPPGLRRPAASFPDAPHDVHAARRSVARGVGTTPLSAIP